MNQLHFNFPFQKIDTAKRIVTGVATADNVDPSGDLVEFQASMDAFSNWVGNIREMHGKEAVGKNIGYRPVTISHNGETYRGIEVDVYISKGAENTWQKILDGTLRGFSIGGSIIEKSAVYDEKLKRKINEIKKYSLGELSVVDNPANPAAMFSMVKVSDAGVFEAQHDAQTFKVFYCENDQVAKADSNICTYCDSEMTELGYLDSFSIEAIEKLLDNNNFTKASSDNTFTPPSSVRSAAKRAIGWISEGKAGGGFTSVGRRRASMLANGDSISLHTIRRMYSYFSRHEVDKKATGFNSGEEGFPTPGRVAWDAWGGDAGYSWVRGIIRREDGMKKSQEVDFVKQQGSEMLISTLQSLLPDVVNLYLRTHAAHWNVTGADFAQYHDLFGSIYDDVYSSIDPIAENVRKLGGFVENISMGTSVETDDTETLDLASEVLMYNLDILSKLKKAFDVANIVNEQGIANFIAERIDMHEKWNWQLQASLTKGVDVEMEKVTGGHKTPPKGYPQDKSQYADPANFKYPVDTAERAMAAMKYYNQSGQQQAGGYTSSQWSSVGSKIVSALNRLTDGKYKMENGKIVNQVSKGVDMENDIEKANTCPDCGCSVPSGEDTCPDCGADMEKAAGGGDKCPNCGASVPSSATTCPECGKTIVRKAKTTDASSTGADTVTCPNCGKSMAKGAKMCKACGSKMKKSASLQNNINDDNMNFINANVEDQKVSLLKTMVQGVFSFVNGPSSIASTDSEVYSEDEIAKSEDGGSEMDINELKEAISEIFDQKIVKVADEINAAVDAKIESLTKSVETVSEKVEAASTTVTEVTEKVAKIDEETAIKKSADPDEEEAEEVVEKSTFWNGLFVPAPVREALGYDS